MVEKMLRKPVIQFLIPVFLLLTSVSLTACGVRLYDYVAPYLQTRAVPYQNTVTPASTLTMVPAFTPIPSASPTATLTSTAYVVSIESPTPTAGITPLEGTAEVTLDNRTGETLVVELEGTGSFGYEIAPAGLLHVQIPAGTYRYMLVLSGQKTLHGSKTFFAGPLTWTFYRTPGVVESPTPRWP